MLDASTNRTPMTLATGNPPRCVSANHFQPRGWFPYPGTALYALEAVGNGRLCLRVRARVGACFCACGCACGCMSCVCVCAYPGRIRFIPVSLCPALSEAHRRQKMDVCLVFVCVRAHPRESLTRAPAHPQAAEDAMRAQVNLARNLEP